MSGSETTLWSELHKLGPEHRLTEQQTRLVQRTVGCRVLRVRVRVCVRIGKVRPINLRFQSRTVATPCLDCYLCVSRLKRASHFYYSKDDVDDDDDVNDDDDDDGGIYILSVVNDGLVPIYKYHPVCVRVRVCVCVSEVFTSVLDSCLFTVDLCFSLMLFALI